METFIREKVIDCGEHYREVDVIPYSESQESHNRKKGKRAKRERISEPKQKNLNDKNSRRYFVQLGNMNFAHDKEALHVTVTYDQKYLPTTLQEAEKEVSNYLRRISYARKKADLPKLKYILVTEHSGVDDSYPVRVHHHIIMNGGLNRDMIEKLWSRPRKKGEKEGDSIGFANADRLQSNESGITALCVYLSKQHDRKKRWTSSHNLERPHCQSNDDQYTKREVEAWTKADHPVAFWENLYPGWTITNPEYGVRFEFNEVTATWSVYLKLRKKDRRN